MTDLLIRKIDPKLKAKLQRRARAHGRSLSAEAHALLDLALHEPGADRRMGSWMRSLVPEEFRGDDLVFEYKGDFPNPPDFD